MGHEPSRPPADAAEKKQAWGLLAEFKTPGQLLRGARAVRDAGYRRWDCMTPYPVHGLNQAMGLRDTRLPWIVLAAGASGTGLAILMQTWMNAVDYPLNIGGKPLFSLPAQIPIVFEVTVLLAATTAFLGMFVFNKLPQFYYPAFRSRRFRRVTDDRFFIAIEAADPEFEVERTEALLREVGSVNVEWLED